MARSDASERSEDAGDNARRSRSDTYGAGAEGRGAGANEERRKAPTSVLESAKRSHDRRRQLSGAILDQADSAGLRPEDILVYVERSKGRRSRQPRIVSTVAANVDANLQNTSTTQKHKTHNKHNKHKNTERKQHNMTNKPVINYKVVRQTDPRTGKTTCRPTIVERAQTLDAETVARLAYQNGLTNVKPDMSKPIAQALGEQIVVAALNGHSVKMGDYFRTSLHLAGSCPPDGTLGKKNTIRVRLRRGTKFNIPFNTFKYQNIDSDLVPKVDFCISDCAGAERNKPKQAQVLSVLGSRLEGNNMVTKVEFWQVSAGGEIIGDRPDYEFGTFISHGANLLTFELGTTILPKDYVLKVSRTRADGTNRTESLGLAVTVVAA